MRGILGAKYLVSFSSRSLKMREKYISLAQLVLLSLYIFWGKCAYYIIQKLKSKHTSLKKYWYKLSKTNIFFSRFEGTRGERNQIFRTKVMHLNAELDMENKFKADLNKKHNKAERKFREMEFQWEEERKSSGRLQVHIKLLNHCQNFSFKTRNCDEMYVMTVLAEGLKNLGVWRSFERTCFVSIYGKVWGYACTPRAPSCCKKRKKIPTKKLI